MSFLEVVSAWFGVSVPAVVSIKVDVSSDNVSSVDVVSDDGVSDDVVSIIEASKSVASRLLVEFFNVVTSNGFIELSEFC